MFLLNINEVYNRKTFKLQAIISKAQSVVKSDAPGFTEVVRWSANHSTDQKGVSPGSFASLTTFNLDL